MGWDLILQVTEEFWGWTVWMDLNMSRSQLAPGVWDNPIQAQPQFLGSTLEPCLEKAAAMWCDPGPAEWLLLLALWDVPLQAARRRQQSGPALLWVKQLILSK